MKYFVCVLALIAVSSCTKDEHPGLGKEDSLLVTTLKEPYDTIGRAEVMDTFVVDSLTARRQRDEATLQRFDPKDVVKIYDGYHPLRNGKTTKAQLDSFCAAYKITAKELHAVLAEGDRLGWAK